ncbi:MAG: VOC family protein [Candidatus Latescibacteria bacterium]|nr:VOC family protein [Candidatus Latescibacterota bacterium]
MNPVNWFEIPVTELNRAKEFYEYVFEVELTLNGEGPWQMAWFPMNQGIPGSTGALVKSEGYIPSYEGTVIYFTVESLDVSLKKVEEKGGKTIFPRMSIGEYGFIAHFEDTEGNRVALHAIK